MPEIDLKLTLNFQTIALAMLALLVFGIGYAYFVRRIRSRYPEHGYTAVLVVFGVACVTVAFTAITSLPLGALLLALMAAAGAPMVWEYTDFYLTAAEDRRLTATIKNLTERNNGIPPEARGPQVATNGHRRP